MKNKEGKISRLYKIILPPVFVLAGILVFSSPVKAMTYISVDTVWTKEQSPIVVSDNIWVSNGATLTIEPGAIVKIKNYKGISVSGSLKAIGTIEEPIIFTSIKDDEYGGDTNGDGSATKPQPGDWSYLETVEYGAVLIIDHAELKYGEYFSIDYADEFIMTNSSVLNFEDMIYIKLPKVAKINYSNIYNPDFCTTENPFTGEEMEEAYCGGAMLYRNFYYDGYYQIVDATNNYWGHPEGPSMDGANIKGTAIYDGFAEWMAEQGMPSPPKFADYEPFLTSPWQQEPPKFNPVIIVPGIMGSWFSNQEGWQLDPILGTYDNLYKALVENGGYIPEETLFKFPYEWRQDNALSAYQLKQKIDEIKNICQCDKVDIIAHSMGGLVARYYIESSYYGNDIDRLVFLGTPHKGSPDSYLVWEGALEIVDQFRDFLLKKYFTLEAHARGYETLFDYIQDYIKSVEQLLPDYAYLKDTGQTSFRIYDKINYPNNYPYNIFLENLNSEENLSKFAASGVEILNIIGDTGDNTIGAIELSSGESYWPMWQHGYAEESIKLTGDDTVPEVSSSFFTPTKINGADHLSLPSKAQNQVIEYLAGQTPTYEIIETPEPQEVLVVSVYSPVDFAVISPSGKRLGKDFINNGDINEIDNAFYSGFESETEFAVIVNPEEGEYKVEIEGTGEGEYKLNVDYVEENSEAGQSFTGNITAEQSHSFDFGLDKEAEDPISDLEPDDNIPPTITINSPAPGEQYPHSENIIIDYAVIDDFSGIATTTLMLNNQILATTTLNLFDYGLGTSTLKIIATDNASNIGETHFEFKIIADIDSAISDIKVIYNNGWLTDKKSGNLLVSGLKHLKKELKHIDNQINKTKEEIEKIINSQKPGRWEKKLRELNKKLEKLMTKREIIIERHLDKLTEELDKIKNKNKINDEGYDIILNNFNYLRENL